MPTAYFFQDCPVCGRQVRIKAEYLGRRVSCLHCEGDFVALDHESRFHAEELPASGLLERVERLLSIAPPPAAQTP